MTPEELCDELERLYAEGNYAELTVDRPWSEHNPVLKGELARPGALRDYLLGEFRRLSSYGATLSVAPSRPRLGLDHPGVFAGSDESDWDLQQKKLFLFPPERMELSLNRLDHYTGTSAEDFQRHVLFTNYQMHVDEFLARYPDCVRPERDGAQMPAYHHQEPGGSGVTLVNIGVGPSNAKTITDHVAVLRPSLFLMIGHCGGLRNHQEIGDYVLASTYLRADQVLDDVLPSHVPVISNVHLNRFLMESMDARTLPYRMGTVYTTSNRNWEFNQRAALADITLARAMAVDMESATVAANGYRYRIPAATLLCVSDKPLHGKPKLSGDAQEFYDRSKRLHLELAVEAVGRVRDGFSDGVLTANLRSSDEPLIGGPLTDR